MIENGGPMTPQGWPLWLGWIEDAGFPQEGMVGRTALVIGWSWNSERQAFTPVVFRAGGARPVTAAGMQVFEDQFEAKAVVEVALAKQSRR